MLETCQRQQKMLGGEKNCISCHIISFSKPPLSYLSFNCEQFFFMLSFWYSLWHINIPLCMLRKLVVVFILSFSHSPSLCIWTFFLRNYCDVLKNFLNIKTHTHTCEKELWSENFLIFFQLQWWWKINSQEVEKFFFLPRIMLMLFCTSL